MRVMCWFEGQVCFGGVGAALLGTSCGALEARAAAQPGGLWQANTKQVGSGLR